jgi:hypothetical protein
MALNDRALMEAVFNHLVLPPKVPSHAEEDPAAIQTQILDRAIRACNTLRELTGEEFTNTWLAVRHSLSTCLNLNQGRLDKSSMLREFSNIRHTDLIILYVVEQNAAVLIRPDAQYVPPLSFQQYSDDDIGKVWITLHLRPSRHLLLLRTFSLPKMRYSGTFLVALPRFRWMNFSKNLFANL